MGQNLGPSRRGLWGEINAIARGIPTQIFIVEISGIQRQLVPGRKRSVAVSATANVRDEASPGNTILRPVTLVQMDLPVIVPAEAKQALSIIQKELADSLVAVYLHGSAASGELRPRSDVDVLAIIDEPMTSEVRGRLTSKFMGVSGRYPFDPDGRRPLEVIIFLRSDLLKPPYPARSEFIYGEWLRHQYEAGESSEPVSDPELTLVLAQSSQEAKPLFGPNASELLPTVPSSDVRRAMKDVLPTLTRSLQGDERNVLLTLARMWRTGTTGEFVSKDTAAEWAASQLPQVQANILTDAREAYSSGGETDWKYRQQELQLTVTTLQHHILANL